MCGIAGALIPNDPEEARVRVDRMLAALGHRGPDGGGVAQAGVAAVGMCRLRIRSPSDVILPFKTVTGARAAYNGEVYFGSSAAPSGGTGEIAALLSHERNVADGMYALAVLEDVGSLRLLRDPLGIKPLFIRHENNSTSFSSELPALLQTGAPVEVDIDALHELLAFGRTLNRVTLYRGVRELTPGTDLFVSPNGLVRIADPLATPAPTKEPIDVATLRASLRESIARTLISERPIGLAVSGGIDSSILAYELRALGVRQLRTISLALPDNGDGLACLSDLGLGDDPVSATWGHTVQEIDDNGYFAGLISASRRMGEPFRMSSIPLYYALGEAADAHNVRVLFLGEGADEIFGGYESYKNFDPAPGEVPAAVRDFYLGGRSGNYLAKLIGLESLAALAQRLHDATAKLVAGRSPKQALLSIERLLSLEPLLRRADHALMAVGVEGRTPFLHGRLPTLAAALPDSELWSDVETKVALRRAYRDVIPRPSVALPKRALRAPLRLWREAGVVALEALATQGRGLLASLHLAQEGVSAVRDGCAAGDPAAVPLAVALLSTGACLSRLAEEDRLADPELASAAREASAVFSPGSGA